MSLGHVAKDISFIAWSRVHFFGGIRGSDGKKMIIIAVMLGNIIWVVVSPLV